MAPGLVELATQKKPNATQAAPSRRCPSYGTSMISTQFAPLPTG